MLPDLRLLIPATVATFFLAAAAGLFASVRVTQDSLATHADNRAGGDESPITRISTSWPMPGANRAVALRELSDIVKETALAPVTPPAEPVFAAPIVSPAAASPVATPMAESAAPAEAPATTSVAAAPALLTATEPPPATLQPQPVPETVAVLPEPSSDSDGRPDLPAFAEETTKKEPEAEKTPPEPAQTESVASLSKPEKTQTDEPKEPEEVKPDPGLSEIPVEPESTSAIPQSGAGTTTTPPVTLPVLAPLPVIASRPAEPEASTPEPQARDVPDVVVTKPRRTYRVRRAHAVRPQQPKQKIQPAPDINELEPYERFSRSPANIFYTAVN